LPLTSSCATKKLKTPVTRVAQPKIFGGFVWPGSGEHAWLSITYASNMVARMNLRWLVGENYQIIATFEVDGSLPQKSCGSRIA